MDVLFQGLVVGATFGIIGLGVALTYKLLRSKSEAARRTKIVLGVIVAGMIVIMTYQAAKFTGVAILAGTTVAAVWIFKGRKVDTE